MNKQQILEQIDELKQKIEELENQVNSIEFEGIKKCVRYYPQNSEGYFYIASDGEIIWTRWYNTISDLSRFKLGNCFKTRKEAEAYKENLLTKQALKDLALELNNGVEIDWGKHNPKYFIYLTKQGELLDQSYNIYDNCSTKLYCLSEKFLDIAKERIGEEKLIKLIKSGV